MNRKAVWLSVIGILLGFAGGFLVANALNRSQLSALQTENMGLREQAAGTGKNQAGEDLSRAEIDGKLAEAKENPDNFEFQKQLGLALYRYAASKQDAELLVEVAALLERAFSLNPDDYQVMVSLANVNYDLGQINRTEQRNLKARELYLKALSKYPQDTGVITDLGLTYLLSANPDPANAAVQFETTLKIDPRHERALRYMTEAQIAVGDEEKANGFLKRLKEVNRNHPGMADLESKLTKIVKQ